MRGKKTLVGFLIVFLLMFFVGATEPVQTLAASSPDDASSGEEAGQTAKSYQLQNSDIRNFQLQIFKNGEWITPQEPIVIDRDDQVRFNVDYSIPAGVLVDGMNTVCYKLPEAISTFTGSGEVKSGSAVVGTYEIVDGEVRISFDPSFVEKSGAFGIVGSFQASGKASQIKESEDGKGADILFNSDKKLHITFKSANPDLSVSKSVKPGPDGVMTYQMELTSQNGTNEPVVVKDAINGAALVDGSVAIINQDGEPVSGALEPSPGGFTLTLPKMDASSTYTITYQAKLPSDFSGARTSVQNQAQASSGDVKAQTEPVKQDYGVTMEKTGKERMGKAIWTITINNAGGMDLSGMSLEDLIKKDGVKVDGATSASLSVDGAAQTTIPLPYTFPAGSTADTYQIVLESDASAGAQAYTLHNEASLTKPGKAPITAGADLHIDQQPDFGVLKGGTGVEEYGDQLTLNWDVTLMANNEKKAPFTVRDELDDGSTMNSSDLLLLMEELDLDVGVGNYEIQTLPKGASQNFTGFEITFLSNWAPGTVVNLIYQSNATKPPASGAFYNTIRSGDAVSTGVNTYSPEVSIKKEGTGVSLGPLGETVVLDWNVELVSKAQQMNASPYVLEDRFDDGQWMTNEQYDALKNQLDQTFGEGNFNLSSSENAGKITGFTITVNTPPAQGTKTELTYQTSTALPEESTARYQNTAEIENGPKSTGENTFTYPAKNPLVEKCDMNEDNTTAALTYHYYEDIKGELKWLVRVCPEQNQKGGDLTIREFLPEGVTLDQLVLSLPSREGGRMETSLLENGSLSNAISYGGEEYLIGLTQSGRVLSVTIPSALIPKGYNELIELEVGCKIDKPFPGEMNAEHTQKVNNFENQVSVIENGQPLATTSQTQQVCKEMKTGFLEKAGSQKGVDDGVNELSYTVDVNPKAQDLIYGKTDISVVDTLSYEYNQESQMVAYFQASSLKVEYKDSSGNYKPLPQGKWSYTTESKAPSYGDYEKDNHCFEKLSFILPDNMAIRITYTYRLSGVPGSEGEVNNNVKLSGYSKGASSNMNSRISKIAGSATAEASVVYVKKVDATNNQVTLNGAEFKLYIYKPQAETPDHFVECPTMTPKEQKTVTTKEQKILTPQMQVVMQNGIGVLTPINFNTAYKIVETKAPDGYALDPTPYYFYIPSSNTQDWPVVMPQDSGLQIHPVNSLCEITIGNSKKLHLPEAGGMSQLLFMGAGIGLLVLSGAALFRKIR